MCLTLFLTNNNATGQDIASLVPQKKPALWYLPSYFRIGADITRPIGSIVDRNSTAFEFNADFDVFRQFLITADFGMQDKAFSDDFNSADRGVELPHGGDIILSRSMDDQIEGYYYKYGIAWNLSPRNPNYSTIVLGLKRAQSIFDEKLDYSVQYQNWGDKAFAQSFSGKEYQATWYEITFGAQVQLWKDLMINTVGSYKFGKSVSGGNPELLPSYAPGFGKLTSNKQLGISLGLMYRINFKKPYIPAKKKKKK